VTEAAAEEHVSPWEYWTHVAASILARHLPPEPEDEE
jgi:hypothetical protein